VPPFFELEIPEVTVIFVNKDNHEARELIDREGYCDLKTGKVISSKLNCYDINLRKGNEIKDLFIQTLQVYLLFCMVGNDDIYIRNVTQSITDKQAVGYVKMLSDAMFWLKTNISFRNELISYKKKSPCQRHFNKDELDQMQSLSFYFDEMSENNRKEWETKGIIKGALGIALSMLKDGNDAHFVKSIPYFIIDVLYASMTVNDAYVAYIREMVSFAQVELKNGKSPEAVANETGFSDALLSKLVAFPDLILDDLTLHELEKLAWI
jgi:hypothetical protein